MDAAALRRSWSAVDQLGDRAAAYFYAVLFTLDPRLRDLFPITMSGQRERLLAALGHIVSHVDDKPRLETFLRQLGRDHWRFEVRPEHYPLFKQALLHTLAKALQEAWTPELAADWAEAYEIVSSAMIEAASTGGYEPAGWNAEIIAHERRCPDIAVITVRVEGDCPYQAGQSLAVESHLRPRVWRHLSPANAPRSDGTMEFHVRAVPGGQLSPALVYQAQVGDILRLSPPIGQRLTVPPGPGPNLLLLAGGTGLAPLKAVVDQLVRDHDDRRVTMIVGVAFRHELYDVDDLTRLAYRHHGLNLLAALSSDPSLGAPLTVAEAALRNGPWNDRQTLICGSPAMVSGTWHALVQHGYPPQTLRIEQYDGTTYPPLQALVGSSKGA
jgi:NAD(P)H-flavin reductase/hemoglobin-like flavoprotein